MQLDESYADVRVVGGENSLEERPLTEGLELFGTGVEVSRRFCPHATLLASLHLWQRLIGLQCMMAVPHA